MTRAMLFVVLLAGASGCRDYAHFANTNDASAEDDGGRDGFTDGDASVHDDAGAPDASFFVCAPATPGADVPIAREVDHEFQASLPAPASVVLVHFPGQADSSALALATGDGSRAMIIRVDDINSDTGAVTSSSLLSDGAATFAAAMAADGDVHIVVARNTTVDGTLSEFHYVGTTLVQLGQTVATTYRPSTISFADVDGNGEPDLLVGVARSQTDEPRLDVHPSPAVGVRFIDAPAVSSSLDAGMGLPTTIVAVRAKATMDVMYLGVLQPGQAGTSSFQLLQSAGSFSFAGQPTPPVSTSAATLTAADVDADGSDDLVLGGYESANGKTELEALTGIGTSNMQVLLIPVSGYAFGLQRIDWNADGLDDLFLYEQPTQDLSTVVPTILQNKGGTNFVELSPAMGVSALAAQAVPAIAAPAAQRCPPRLVAADTYRARVVVYEP